MNEALMLESDFRLCGMDVDIHILKGNRHEKNHDRECARRQHVPIRFADGVHDDLVADQPAVHEEEHRMPVVLLNVRPRGEDMDLQARPPEILSMLHELVEQVVPEDLKNPFAEVRLQPASKELRSCRFSEGTESPETPARSACSSW